MICLLKAEWQKNRGRRLGLTAGAILLFGCVIAFYGKYEGDSAVFFKNNGYMLLLYQLPLITAMVFPLLSAVVASRLCELEHKGQNLKALCTMAERGKLFDVKLCYGLGIVLLSVLLFCAAAVVYGWIEGFTEEFPYKLYLYFFLCTALSSAETYMLQHSMSLLIKNQAVALSVAAFGIFCGLFSMFLPYPQLRLALPYGGYGALQFVGMFGWTKETRYANAYFEVSPPDIRALLIVLGITVAIYLAGKLLFSGKEL